jgi:hypothetical protein
LHIVVRADIAYRIGRQRTGSGNAIEGNPCDRAACRSEPLTLHRGTTLRRSDRLSLLFPCLLGLFGPTAGGLEPLFEIFNHTDWIS